MGKFVKISTVSQPTLCLLGFVNTTVRALMVIEGRTATQVVTNMVSQTSGLLKAFDDAPADSKRQPIGFKRYVNMHKGIPRSI